MTSWPPPPPRSRPCRRPFSARAWTTRALSTVTAAAWPAPAQRRGGVHRARLGRLPARLPLRRARVPADSNPLERAAVTVVAGGDQQPGPRPGLGWQGEHVGERLAGRAAAACAECVTGARQVGASAVRGILGVLGTRRRGLLAGLALHALVSCATHARYLLLLLASAMLVLRDGD